MIFINYGSEIIKNTYETLAESDVGTYLRPGMQVSLKPNLVVPCPARDGATTHPEVVEGIIKYLRDFGISKIKIIESSWVGEHDTALAYKYCGYEELSVKYDIPLIDLKTDSHAKYEFEGYEISVCDEAMHTDFLINIPVLKAHCQTDLTCCLKNLKGCIPDSEKRRFHTLGIHKPVAALNGIIKTGYCIVDGICGDLSFEEGGNPIDSKRIIAGRNPLNIDSYCAELIGYKPEEIGYIRYAHEYGLGELYSTETRLIEINSADKPTVDMHRDRIAEKYRKMIDEDAACSACYASLIFALHRMGSKAKKLGGTLHIGQGYKGKTGKGIGIGVCCRGFEKNITGCPPKAIDILNALGRV